MFLPLVCLYVTLFRRSHKCVKFVEIMFIDHCRDGKTCTVHRGNGAFRERMKGVMVDCDCNSFRFV